MKPLILEYSKPFSAKFVIPLFNYDTTLELNQLELNTNNDFSNSVYATSSLFTEAAGDPTRDESTDR